MTPPARPTNQRQRSQIEASNPRTPADRLLKLARSRHRDLRIAVASNPSAPTEALRVLIEEFPREVSGNAGWSLATLVDPSLLQQARLPLAREASDPVLLQWLIDQGDREVGVMVARNPATPPSALWKLLERNDPLLRWSLATHPQAPPDLLRKLAEQLPNDESLACALRRNPTTPDALLRHLMSHPPPQYPWDPYRDLVQNSAAPGDLLATAASFPSLHAQAAAHPRTPGETLTELANHHDTEVRRHVASNPSTPSTTLDTLARNPSNVLRRRVAENPASSVATLEHLTHDSRLEVRSAAATNLRHRAAKTRAKPPAGS